MNQIEKDMRNVICLKWGDRYGPDYANALFRAVTQNLNETFRFVCFTDCAEGIDDGVEIFPIPEIDLPEDKKITGWRKLCLFRDDLPLTGPCLFLDLDIVVTGDLDPFFQYGDPDCIPIIHNWISRRKAWSGRDPKIGNSSVFRFQANQCRFIWDQFHEEKDWALTNFQPPQSYLTHCIRDQMIFWPDEWVRSFKQHCRPPFPLNYFRQPQVPENARIVAFHGRPDPDEALRGYSGKKPHHRSLPATWIGQYWQ